MSSLTAESPATVSATGTPPQPESPVVAFDRSSEFYDAFYSTKPYDEESRLYLHYLGGFGHGRLLIEWGAGTGEFTRRFGHAGWKVAGIEPSAGMRKVAESKQVLGMAAGSLLDTQAGWLGLLPPDAKADAAAATFTSLCYAAASQPDGLAVALRNVRRWLKDGGIFAFDVIHTMAMVRPGDTRKVELPGGQAIRRTTETKFTAHDCVIERRFNFDVIETNPNVVISGPLIKDQWLEVHRMRSFTVPELSFALRTCGFEPLLFMPMPENPPRTMDEGGVEVKSGDWSIFGVARAV